MESLEESGIWWPAEDPTMEWSGTLRFDHKSGATLSLIQATSPEDSVEAFKCRLEGGLDQYDVIHGENVSGKEISLLKCFDHQSFRGTAGVETKQIYANSLLHGFWAETSDPEITKATAVLRHLPAWLGRSGLSVSQSDGCVLIHHRHQDSHQLVEKEGLSILIRPSRRLKAKTTTKGKSASLHEEFHLVVETAESRPLSYFQDIVAACRDLFSVACQRYCQIEEQTFARGKNSGEEEARFYAVPAITVPAPRSEPIAEKMLFSCGEVPDLQAAFTRWVDNMEGSRPVRGLYNSAVYGENVLEGRFLAFTQAVEATHRRFWGGAHMEPEEYATEILPSLVDAIPNDLDKSFRNSLKARLKYGYDYPLRKRLNLLLSEHEQAIEKVAPDAKSLSGKVVDLRNWLTHLPPEGEVDAGTEDFLRYEFLLRLLLELSFLAEIGFSPQEIADLAESCKRYCEYSARFCDK